MSRWPISGALLGVFAFVALYGFAILDPTNIAWLLHGDPAQHYLGFAFFRDAPWDWPIGRIPQFGMPSGTSIVYTDSIPLLAILLKPVSAWLPTDFQYFGLWMALCYGLYGYFSARLLGRLGLSGTHRWLAVLVLLTSPALALRAYGHEALMAHWLLLACFDAVLAERSRWHWPLLAVAGLVHAYWVVLLLPFALLGWWRQPVSWRHHLSGLTLFITVLAAAGYFTAQPTQLVAEGYGHYSANLLAFLDPMDWRAFLEHYGRPLADTGEWSRLLPALGQATWGQYEGFAYLGAGVLLLWVLAITLGVADSVLGKAPVIERSATQPMNLLLLLLVVAALMFVYALSSRITLGTRILADPDLPAGLLEVLGVFRSTGRFVWPLAILIPLWALAALARRVANLPLALILAIVLILQAWDLSDKRAEFVRRFAPGGLGQMPAYDAPAWKAAACYRHLVVVPSSLEGDAWIKPALFAARHHQSINLAYVARADAMTLATAERDWRYALLAGNLRPDTAYLLHEEDLLASMPVKLNPLATRLQADGYTFVLPGTESCSAP